MTDVKPPSEDFPLEPTRDAFDKTNSFLLLLVLSSSAILLFMAVYMVYRFLIVYYGPGKDFTRALPHLRKIKKTI